MKFPGETSAAGLGRALTVEYPRRRYTQRPCPARSRRSVPPSNCPGGPASAFQDFNLLAVYSAAHFSSVFKANFSHFSDIIRPANTHFSKPVFPTRTAAKNRPEAKRFGAAGCYCFSCSMSFQVASMRFWNMGFSMARMMKLWRGELMSSPEIWNMPYWSQRPRRRVSCSMVLRVGI